MTTPQVETVKRPTRHQPWQPGVVESQLAPGARSDGIKYKGAEYRGSGKLLNKVAFITGGDSGIGRAVAIAFAKEGADVAFGYLDEHQDARDTRAKIISLGRRCLAFSGDAGEPDFCTAMVSATVDALGKLDILVNNAAEQHPQENFLAISAKQLERTFRTNIFSYFFMAREAVRHMPRGSAIINTTSLTAYRGNAQLVDYASTKAAIVGFTRSLALSLVDKGIRVNGVAPGPIWTPHIPASLTPEHLATFGTDVPMRRAGQPDEVAPSFVFLASSDSSYMTGQVLHPNGGEVVNA